MNQLRPYRLALIAALASASACAVATGQPVRFRTQRPIQFHLAENEAAPGLIAVHVSGEARIIYLHPEVKLDDRDIRSAVVVKDAAGQPAVQVRLRPSGIQKFNALPDSKQYKTLAIAVNDKVIFAPLIEPNGKLIDDLLDITGAITAAEAASLAKALNR